jgi:hypothetical protein
MFLISNIPSHVLSLCPGSNQIMLCIQLLTYQLNGQIGPSTLLLQPYLPVSQNTPCIRMLNWTHTHCITCSMLNCFFFSTDITQNTPSNHGNNCRCSTFSSPSACTSLGKQTNNYGNHSWCSAVSLPLAYTSQRTYTVTIATTVTIKE